MKRLALFAALALCAPAQARDYLEAHIIHLAE